MGASAGSAHPLRRQGRPKVKVVGRHAGAMQKVRDKRVRSFIDVVVGKDFEDLEPLSSPAAAESAGVSARG